MDQLGQYILSVASAAFLAGILGSLTDKKSGAGSVLRLLSGLFLTFTVISPIVKMDFSGITDYMESYAREGENTAAWGDAAAEDERRTIIKSRVEAYILDKAEALGTAVTVEVTLSDDIVPVPEEALLRGAVSPYVRTRLEQMMEADLGIAKENQLWIGQPQQTE